MSNKIFLGMAGVASAASAVLLKACGSDGASDLIRLSEARGATLGS